MNKEKTHQDIDRPYHLGNGKLEKNKPWPIIIKFSRYNVRAKNFKNKRKLKGKWIRHYGKPNKNKNGAVAESYRRTKFLECLV